MNPVRVLVLGAHPDDAEVYAGGLLHAHRNLGSIIRIISVTDGRSGHQSIPESELIPLRREEARRAGLHLGAEYWTWDFPDGYLEPSLEVRGRIIRELREFQPDLVLTHRTCDYHPDHRAVGQAVQDASYLVTVPKIVPGVPALRQAPLVASMADTFSRPNPLRPDLVLDVSPYLDDVIAMMACHASQFFDWLPYNQGVLHEVPEDPPSKLAWLKHWMITHHQRRTDLFWPSHLPRPTLIEAFEISEYAAKLTDTQRERLFPQCITHS